ncbi:MAG: lipopolysaccharide biosynthesis protein [Rikenellaceae bacterium]
MKKSELSSGVFFTAIAKYSSVIIMLVVSAILARLLTPEDFGTVTIATVILSFFVIISDLGIATAIVQNKQLTETDNNNIFSFTVYLGIGIAIIFYLLSPLVADFYDVKSIVYICRALSINLLFASLNIVPNALLLKAKRFKFIAVRTILVQLVFGAISIFAAFKGLGIYALLINPIGSSIAIFIFNYIQYPQKFSIHVERESIDKISKYSMYQFLFSIINYFSRNIDNLLIGRYIGIAQLGYYDKSYRLMMLPLSNIAHVITPVLHPLLSEHQDDREYIFKSYLKLLNLLAYVGFPLSVFLYFEASNLIFIVFGSQWADSIPIFKILAISVGAQMLTSSLGSIFQSTNETKRLFKIGNINTATNVMAIVSALVYFGSIKAVAIFITIAFYINAMVSFYYLFDRVFSKSVVKFVSILRNPILLSILLVLICKLTAGLFSNSIISLFTTFLIVSTASILFIQLSKDFDLLKIIKSSKR